MKINTLGYCIKQGMKNIQRNLLFSLASVGTMVACLFMFGIFYSILVNIGHEMTDIQKSLTVSVFFEEGASDDQIAKIGNEIQKWQFLFHLNLHISLVLCQDLPEVRQLIHRWLQIHRRHQSHYIS